MLNKLLLSIMAYFSIVTYAYADVTIGFPDFFNFGSVKGIYDNRIGLDIVEADIETEMFSSVRYFQLKNNDIIFLKKNETNNRSIPSIDLRGEDLLFQDSQGLEITVTQSGKLSIFYTNNGGKVTISKFKSAENFEPEYEITGKLLPNSSLVINKNDNVYSGLYDISIDMFNYKTDESGTWYLTKSLGNENPADLKIDYAGKNVFLGNSKIIVDSSKDLEKNTDWGNLEGSGQNIGPFVDISDSFAKDRIVELYEAGYVKGYEGNLFKPNQGITRAEFLKIAMSAFGKLEGVDLNRPTSDDDFVFTDTIGWASVVAKKAKDAGYVSGRNGGFRPNDPITRAEALKILVNVSGADLSGYETLTITESAFEDVLEDWMVRFVNYANDNAIVSGQNGKFRPNDAITRAEAVKIIKIAN